MEEVVKEHCTFLKGLQDIKYIKFLGHSITQVDQPYFQLITQCAATPDWTSTYYGQQNHDLLGSNICNSFRANRYC